MEHATPSTQHASTLQRFNALTLQPFNPSTLYYLLALALFALGLMSKPMLVTLPCVLLLLDFWPLDRLKLSHENHRGPAGIPLSPTIVRRFARLVLEKVPFFGLTLASSVVTWSVQESAMSSFQVVPMPVRVGNAILAYGRYLSKTIWPSGLAVIYPYQTHLSAVAVIAVALLLLTITIGCCLCARRCPFLIVGWLWFLGMLVPTIGLVQVGSQAIADRYMYIPAIGLFVMIAWGVTGLLESKLPEGSKWAQPALAGSAVMALMSCLWCTSHQLSYWRNDETLFRHAVEVTDGNYIAWDRLGAGCLEAGKLEEALARCSEAVRLKPNYAEGQYNLGTILLKTGKTDEAQRHFEIALRNNPSFGNAHINLGKVLLDKGNLPEAVAHFSKAVALAPADAQAHYNLGTAVLMQGKLDAAADCFSEALRLKPDYSEAHNNLGVTFVRQGKLIEGANHFCAAIQLSPRNAQAYYHLGLALLELNQPLKAEGCFAQARRLEPSALTTRYYLALAIARQERRAEATTEAKTLLELALAAGEKEIAGKAERLLKSCQNGGP